MNCTTIARDTSLVYLHFVAYLAASLSQFMQLFQTDSPLVHVLYDKVNELTRTFLRNSWSQMSWMQGGCWPQCSWLRESRQLAAKEL